MANGPKMAPIVAQNSLFAPLFLAIDQSKAAEAMHIKEMINTAIAIIPYCDLVYRLVSQTLAALVHFSARWSLCAVKKRRPSKKEPVVSPLDLGTYLRLVKNFFNLLLATNTNVTSTIKKMILKTGICV